MEPAFSLRMDEATIAHVNNERAATAYTDHKRVFGNGNGEAPSGLLFDSQTFAVMSINHPPQTETPDLNADKDGDRILILLDGDLALQIGTQRYRLVRGDAVRIPRGTPFGGTHSRAGAHLLLIRTKPLRSFSLLR